MQIVNFEKEGGMRVSLNDNTPLLSLPTYFWAWHLVPRFGAYMSSPDPCHVHVIVNLHFDTRCDSHFKCQKENQSKVKSLYLLFLNNKISQKMSASLHLLKFWPSNKSQSKFCQFFSTKLFLKE